jgi:hypothetical protein
LHPTYYIVIFVEVEDVADVTAVLATAVNEAGHDSCSSEVCVLVFWILI